MAAVNGKRSTKDLARRAVAAPISTARRSSAHTQSDTHVREQLLKLNFEAEDADQAVQLLRDAIAREETRAQDSKDISERWQSQLESQERAQKEELTLALERIDRLLHSKKELSTEAKGLLDQVGNNGTPLSMYTLILLRIELQCL
jgi:small-conductance mechanosensitive channel